MPWKVCSAIYAADGRRNWLRALTAWRDAEASGLFNHARSAAAHVCRNDGPRASFVPHSGKFGVFVFSEWAMCCHFRRSYSGFPMLW
jgi:hypothetical protein